MSRDDTTAVDAPRPPAYHVARRRAAFAVLRARGLSIHEIHVALPRYNKKSRIVNYKTGEPWSLKTLMKDDVALRKRYQKAAARTTEEHAADQYARLMADLQIATELVANTTGMKKRAMLQTKLRVEHALSNLLGTSAPQRLEVAPAGGVPGDDGVPEDKASHARRVLERTGKVVVVEVTPSRAALPQPREVIDVEATTTTERGSGT